MAPPPPPSSGALPHAPRELTLHYRRLREHMASLGASGGDRSGAAADGSLTTAIDHAVAALRHIREAEAGVEAAEEAVSAAAGPGDDQQARALSEDDSRVLRALAKTALQFVANATAGRDQDENQATTWAHLFPSCAGSGGGEAGPAVDLLVLSGRLPDRRVLAAVVAVLCNSAAAHPPRLAQLAAHRTALSVALRAVLPTATGPEGPRPLGQAEQDPALEWIQVLIEALLSRGSSAGSSSSGSSRARDSTSPLAGLWAAVGPGAAADASAGVCVTAEQLVLLQLARTALDAWLDASRERPEGLACATSLATCMVELLATALPASQRLQRDADGHVSASRLMHYHLNEQARSCLLGALNEVFARQAGAGSGGGSAAGVEEGLAALREALLDAGAMREVVRLLAESGKASGSLDTLAAVQGAQSASRVATPRPVAAALGRQQAGQ